MAANNDTGEPNSATQVTKPDLAPLSAARLTTIMAALIFLGSINFCLIKELYSAYGDKYSFFVSQGVNLLYIVYGGLILYPRMLLTNVVTKEMMAASKGRFVIMGTLDSFGTFFTAMGAVYTPGSMQPLLNQMLIPWCLLFNMLYLKKKFSLMELSGAMLITAGACLSALPPVLTVHDTSTLRWYAVGIYMLSNAPMAASSCYKQKNFREQEFDVWYLTQWVSIIQFLVGFLFIPLLCIPGFGTAEGTPLSEIPGQLAGGWDCFLERSDECRGKSTFGLLIGYVAINICYNTLGLYLTKVGSALLNAISYALLLPNTTLLFFTPIVGAVQEPFTATSWFTVAGLFVVLFGFGLYQRYDRGVTVTAEALLTPPPQPKVKSKQPAFQERVIGMGTAFTSSKNFTGSEEPLLNDAFAGRHT